MSDTNGASERIGRMFDALEEVLVHGKKSQQTLRDYERMTKNQQTMHAPIFRKACELANVEPTRRQASKWNNGYGAAWKQRGEARRQLIDQNLDEGIRKGPHVVEMLNAKLEDQS